MTDWGAQSTATDVEAGIYTGEGVFEVRALFGPIRVDAETCDASVRVVVDPLVTPMVDGLALCEFPSYGDVELAITGDLVALPDVEGDLESDIVNGPWHGWFLDNDHLRGQTDGKTPYQGGITLKYTGWFEVVADTPIAGVGG